MMYCVGEYPALAIAVRMSVIAPRIAFVWLVTLVVVKFDVTALSS